MEINIYRNCLDSYPHYFRGFSVPCRFSEHSSFPSERCFFSAFSLFLLLCTCIDQSLTVSLSTSLHNGCSVHRTSVIFWSFASYRFCWRFKCSLLCYGRVFRKSVNWIWSLICFSTGENQSVLSEIVHGSLPFLRFNFVSTVSACSYHHGNHLRLMFRSFYTHCLHEHVRLLTLTIYLRPSMIAIFCFAATICPHYELWYYTTELPKP